MKRAALLFIVLMAFPLTLLLAQGDPSYPPATDNPTAPQADPAQPQPAPVDPPATAPYRDSAADPDAVNDPGAQADMPATAGHGPMILMAGILAIGMFLVLKVFRRRSVDVS